MSTVTDMLSGILTYQAKFNRKTLRLCFSSQEELFSIFSKVFGTP
jgi:hypothetical protein